MVDKHEDRVRLADDRREFSERLAHKARLQTHVAVAHIAFDFRLRSQSRDRVDDDDIDRTRADQILCDFKRLFSRIRLRYPKVVDIDAEAFRILRIEGVLRVDKSCDAAELLRFGDRVESERRLSRRLRSVHFDDTPARIASDAERFVEQNRTGRNHVETRSVRFRAELHQRTRAVLLFDLEPSGFQSL